MAAPRPMPVQPNFRLCHPLPVWSRRYLAPFSSVVSPITQLETLTPKTFPTLAHSTPHRSLLNRPLTPNYTAIPLESLLCRTLSPFPSPYQNPYQTFLLSAAPPSVSALAKQLSVLACMPHHVRAAPAHRVSLYPGPASPCTRPCTYLSFTRISFAPFSSCRCYHLPLPLCQLSI